MTKVLGYDAGCNELRLFPSEADWQVQTTTESAKKYLTLHLREQLVREVPFAVNAFLARSLETGIGVGFWSIPRMLFPSVSFLGTLYRGSDSSASSIEFIEEYIGRRGPDQRYLELFSLVFVMYRHGLVHTAAPKSLERDDGLLVSWRVSYDPGDHLRVERQNAAAIVGFCPSAFYEDLLAALDRYVRDFDDPSRAPGLLLAFKEGFLEMGRVFAATDLKGKSTQNRIEACLRKL